MRRVAFLPAMSLMWELGVSAQQHKIDTQKAVDDPRRQDGREPQGSFLWSPLHLKSSQKRQADETFLADESDFYTLPVAGYVTPAYRKSFRLYTMIRMGMEAIAH